MSGLPEKPAAVAHVSDAHWEAALNKALSTWKVQDDAWPNRIALPEAIDHARCLILLGEAPESVDPIEAALDALWRQVSSGLKNYEALYFKAHCRKHFAGLTFPEAGQ